MKKYLILFSLFSSFAHSQSKVENDYCKIAVSDSIRFDAYKKINEEKGFIDSYKLSVNSNLIGILFIMLNKLEVEASIDENNYNDYIFDLGEITILSVNKEKSYLKIYYKDEKVNGIIYLGNNNDILYRFMFMFPNEDFLKRYGQVAHLIFEKTEYKKNSW